MVLLDARKPLYPLIFLYIAISSFGELFILPRSMKYWVSPSISFLAQVVRLS